jgi:hypothetical protein
LCALSLTLAKPTAPQIRGAAPPSASPAELAAEVEHAAASELYAVDVSFARPTTVGEIRAVSSQLEVPRVLAYVEYGPYVGDRPRGIVILGLGQMYASDEARRHSECRSLVLVNMGENELRERSIDEWPVRKIHVYATAHVVRQLSSGTVLPPAAVIDGATAKPEHLRKLEEYTRNEIIQPIAKPSSVEIPAYCSKLVGAEDSPILSRDFPRDFQPPQAFAGETSRDYAFRLLSQLPPSTAVTIDLKLDFPAGIDFLGSLVEEYDIIGMRADLLPERSDKRIIADAQLTNTLELRPQIHRVRCQMSLGVAQTTGEWHADWINVSLSSENAVRLLSHPNLSQAKVSGSHPITDLDRLKGYYERLATRIYEMPESIEIAPGCQNVYVHNESYEDGSVSAQPSSTP